MSSLKDKDAEGPVFVYTRNLAKILHGLKNDLGDNGLMILDPSLAILCYASMKIQLL